MKLGFIGLGRMGYPMVQMLLRKGQKVVAYNRDQEKTKEIAKDGAEPAFTFKELIDKLDRPRMVWLMVPHAVTDEMIDEISHYMTNGDIIIDGGNSNFNKTVARGQELAKKGILFMDIGVSGGTAAAETGYCMMVGGDKPAYDALEPFIKAMCVKDGYGYMGPSGAGHYTKMVHNAIEYGIMEAMGEGFDLMVNGPYKDTDMLAVAKVWNNGSIIRGFLMEMAINALEHHKDLKDVPGFISDNGEGRWAVEEAMKYNIPFTINSHALFSRYRSRQQEPVSNKMVAALRDEFGGHGFGAKPKFADPIKKKEKDK